MARDGWVAGWRGRARQVVRARRGPDRSRIHFQEGSREDVTLGTHAIQENPPAKVSIGTWGSPPRTPDSWEPLTPGRTSSEPQLLTLSSPHSNCDHSQLPLGH